MTVQGENERRFAELARKTAESSEGQVTSVSYSARTVLVDTGGVEQPMRWLGSAPKRGDRVRVFWVGGQPVCATVSGVALGTVASVGTNVVTVTGDDGGSYTYPHEFGASFSAGQRVALNHDAEVVLFRLSTDPTAKTPATPTQAPVSGRVERTFYPIDSANWWSTGGRWDAPYAEVSVSRSAYYFYGSQIADTIPNSATVLSASIRVVELWDKVGGVASLLGTHTATTRPGSPPALSGATAIDGTGSWDITGLAVALKNGTAFGVGFAQNTGWRRFDSYARSGAITIIWE
jgi:hypothetical protein